MVVLPELLDFPAGLLWITTLQFTVFAMLALIATGAWRRRPALRHAITLAVLIAALAAPLSAAVTQHFQISWLPVPNWLIQAADPTPEHQQVPSSVVPGAVLPPLSEADVRAGSLADERTRAELLATAGADPHDTGRDIDHLKEPPIAKAVAVPAREGRAMPPTNDARATHGLATNADASVLPQHPPVFASILARLLSHPGRLLFLAWLAGFVWCLGWICRTHRRVRQLVSRTSYITDERIVGVSQDVADALSLRRPVKLRASSLVKNPFVYGVMNPQVIVPEALLVARQESELRHVLLHEFSHVGRGDLWVGLIQRCSVSLFWFHPLIHLFNSLLAAAREELCDNQVLSKVSMTDYARTLLQMGARESGLAAPAVLSLFSRAQTLEARIRALLDPRRDRSTHLRPGQVIGLLLLMGALGVSVAGIGPRAASRTFAAESGPKSETAADPVPPDANKTSQPKTEEQLLLDRIRQRVTDILKPSPSVEILEYDFDLYGETAPAQVTRGEHRPRAVWQGATLYAGLHNFLEASDKFDIQIEHQDDKTIRLRAAIQGQPGTFTLIAGNGIAGAYRGYFSHPAQQTVITVDATRLVPLSEETRDTTILYHDWQEVKPGRWIPHRIEIIRDQTRYRLHFDWLGDAIWLLRSSESISPASTSTVATIRNVRINHQQVPQPESEQETRSKAEKRLILDLLDHNRPWLDRGPTGSGWQPPFETLSYTFHTVREDINESCVLDHMGEAALEVTRDGQGVMKERLGARHIALSTEEYATTKRGMTFAAIHGRPARLKDEPFDRSLQQIARIGCQFDLPLFHYRECLNSAKVEITDSEWNGVRCRKATVTDLGGQIFLGCGTMFGFSSQSYVHHIRPTREVLYIDTTRNVVLHETLTSVDKTFEIEFGDYVEPVAGQFAPSFIRVESPGYFTCEYHFQIVAKTHWMLNEVVSWFSPDNKSRGTVQDIQINGSRQLLDESLRQVSDSRRLFSTQKEPQAEVNLAVVPFVLGKAVRLGQHDVRVSLADSRTVSVSVSVLNGASSPSRIPVCFLDAEHRLLLAPSVELTEKDGQRQGHISIRGSYIWNDVKFIAAPASVVAANLIPVKAVPFRWNEPIAINIPDSEKGEAAGDPRGKLDQTSGTRAFRVQVDRQEDGSSRAKLNVVNVQGLREIYYDVSIALVGSAGELLASGHLAATWMGTTNPAERQFEIDLGTIPDAKQPAFLIVGLAPGNVLSQPMGAFWMQSAQPGPFKASALIASSDETCWKMGLQILSDGHGADSISESIFKEFHDESPRAANAGDGKYSRRTLLKPFREDLRRIISQAKQTDVLAAAVRYLAYSEDEMAATLLEPLVMHPAEQVQEAAVIGLTFLNRHADIDRLRAILAREAPSWKNEPDAYRASIAREQDILIALLHQGSDSALNLLGTTLLNDLKQLQHASDEKQIPLINDRVARAQKLCRLLGNAGRPRAVDWLLAALDLVSEQPPELARSFRRDQLLSAICRYESDVQDRIASFIESGKLAEDWVWVLRGSTKPYYIPAVRKFLRKEDLTATGMRFGIRYLANHRTPEALAGLQECYERGLYQDDKELRLTLCHSLAAAGDSRGLKDAFQTLMDLQQAIAPSQNEKERKTRQRSTEELQKQALQVAMRAPKDQLEAFLREQIAGVVAPEKQRVVLDWLWILPTLPSDFVPVVQKWGESTDVRIAPPAKRLLERG